MALLAEALGQPELRLVGNWSNVVDKGSKTITLDSGAQGRCPFCFSKRADASGDKGFGWA